MRRIVPGIVLVVMAVSASATTMFPTKVVCPVDGTTLDSWNTGSSNNFGGTDRDFLRHAAGGNPFVEAVTTCPKCLYSGFPHEFERHAEHDASPAPTVHLAPAVRERFLRGNAVTLPAGVTSRKDLSSWARLALRAQRVALDGRASDVAHAWLQTAWAVRLEGAALEPLLRGIDPRTLPGGAERKGWADDPAADDLAWARRLLGPEGANSELARSATLFALHLLQDRGESPELLAALPAAEKRLGADGPAIAAKLRAEVERERGFQQRTVAAFIKAAAEETQAEERAGATYLAGELSRRVGNTAAAREWLGRVATVTDVPSELERLAEEQLASLPPAR